jgi:hypothetical protein
MAAKTTIVNGIAKNAIINIDVRKFSLSPSTLSTFTKSLVVKFCLRLFKVST